MSTVPPPENDRLLHRLDGLVDRLEAIFGPERSPELDLDQLAWRWRTQPHGVLEALDTISLIAPEDLVGIDQQRQAIDDNTRQFVAGVPCNHVLMWGARGTGKSSLVKAMLYRYQQQGLRLVEVDAHDLIDLPSIVAPLASLERRFILFVDDLSFDANDGSYRTLKAALDGSVSTTPENVVIYATSNRRHLLPEQLVDNEHARLVDGEIHHGEAVEEKISLSERFGVWLSFHPFSQSTYIEAVELWLRRNGIVEFDATLRGEALRWALRRGNRSGRIAAQFARDVAGKRQLQSPVE